jgi:Glycosyl hydrolases family 2, TIM barrel domain
MMKILAILLLLCPAAFSAAIKTQVVQRDGQWVLLRDGKPYFIRGAGGDGSGQLLVEMGGNSVRTWGADDIGPQLDEAQRLGLTVTVGIWLRQERDHFSYNNPDQVAEQYEKVKSTILKYKDYPAVLMWGLGNEMEGYADGNNAAVWLAVDQVAALAHRLDPNHPTMTVVAEIGGQRVQNIHRLCPDIDVVGINSYGGIASVPQRYRAAGGTKPYVITEFGPIGWWETGKNSFGAVPERTSTQKAAFYRQAYQSAVASQPGLCLGSYVFLWGHKQETTATWFGMMLADGTPLEPVEAMNEFWTGKPPAHRAPRIEPIQLPGGDRVAPGQIVEATVNVTDPDGAAVNVEWQLHREPKTHGEGGDYEPPTQQFPDAIIEAANDRVRLRMPSEPGIYRLYAIARDGQHWGACANVPLLVTGP